MPSDARANHSSRPAAPWALNTTPSSAAVSRYGNDPALPGAASTTRTVPAGVPSLRHSSVPERPSVAVKYASPSAPKNSPGALPAFPGPMSARSSIVTPFNTCGSTPVGVPAPDVRNSRPPITVSEPTELPPINDGA